MNWEAIGAVGEVLGAVGVIATLIYLSVQIRQNTRATRAQTHESVTENIVSIANVVAARPEVFASALRASPKEFSALSDGDKVYFFGAIFGMFKYFELMFVQHSQEIIDDDTWNAWSQHILMYFHQPGVQLWWEARKGAFIPDFREYLDGSTAPPLKTMVAVMENRE